MSKPEQPTASNLHKPDPWNLSFPLIEWSPYDSFCLRNACETVAILGELGAAKSTASAAAFLLSYLKIQMGGIVCCVKPGERERIEEYARMAGRADSLIVVSPATKWRCNLLQYVLRRPGIVGSRVEAVVELLMTIAEASNRDQQQGGGNQQFFDKALRQLLRSGVQVCISARHSFTTAELHEVISSMPQTPEQVHDEGWQKSSACYRMVSEADELAMPDRERQDFELSAKYLFRDYPHLPPDTRGSVYATYGVLMDVLLRGQMADLFDTSTNFIPELTFSGAIIILDLPTKVYGQSGVLLQQAFLHLWQMACEQRDVKKNPRPVFMYVDEFQELVNSYTPRFLATSRSARVAPILISQNRPNYLAALGGEQGRHLVDAFLGNIATKVFHANGDPETNRWASETISDEVQTRFNFNRGRGGDGHGSGGGGESVGRKVLPSDFTTLQKGGEQSGFLSEAIVYQTGARFAANNGEPWMRVAFKQIIPGVTVDPAPKF